MDWFDELWPRLDGLLDRVFGELDVHSPIPVSSTPGTTYGVDSFLFEFFGDLFGSFVWAALKWLLAGF